MSDIVQFAQELARLGTRCVFGIPGEGPSLTLVAELEKQGCPFYLVSHEAVGALMAGGFGRLADVPGVSLSIKGPGFGNMLAGIASNSLDCNPMLSLSESYGPGASPHRMHKRMAHAQMARPVVKAYADNPSPSLVPRLWDLCLAEEPGPVHIDISARMQQMSCDGLKPQASGANRLRPEIVKRVGAAQRPLVITGALATRRPWREQLSMLKVPVLTTVAGKGAVDETLACAAGVFTNSGGPFAPESRVLPLADLIIGLGLRTTEILDIKPLPAPLLLLDELAGKAGGLEAVAETVVTGEAFPEIIRLLQHKEWGAAEVATAKAALAEKLVIHSWLPAGALHLAQQVLPASAVFFLDTGNFCTIGEHVLTARRPLHVLGSALGRSMGVGLPTAVGAALAVRGTPVVVNVGDGGVGMYPEAIALAVREKLPLLALFMNDGFFASVRQSAVKQGFPQGIVRLDFSSWTRVFQAFGCPAERIESLVALEGAVQTWKKNLGPLFLELTFDADAYMNMTEGIR